jgi:hypothetical protein
LFEHGLCSCLSKCRRQAEAVYACLQRGHVVTNRFTLILKLKIRKSSYFCQRKESERLPRE